jgi:transcriptional regulator with XRE-family HTH domain
MERQDKLDRKAGAGLREFRKQSGRSQEDLTPDADIDLSMLSKVERKGPAAAGWRRFCRIAAAVGDKVEITFRQKATVWRYDRPS